MKEPNLTYERLTTGYNYGLPVIITDSQLLVLCKSNLHSSQRISTNSTMQALGISYPDNLAPHSHSPDDDSTRLAQIISCIYETLYSKF